MAGIDRLAAAIRSTEIVSGYTHTFYRYPARFSPVFAREAIRRFSQPGDVVLDPFMGGGTSLVEAKAMGRRGIGFDVSSLAVFLTKTKTTLLSDADRRAVLRWGDRVVAGQLNLRTPALRDKEWIECGYQRNMSDRSTWPIRKTVELALGELHELANNAQRMLARCAILRTAQWALDCREVLPSASEFRSQFLEFLNEMVAGSEQFKRACKAWNRGLISESLATGRPTTHRLPPDDEEGKDRELPSGISLPNMVEVHEQEWAEKDPPFDKYTALRIRISALEAEPGQGQSGETESQDVYDFLINMDNVFLKSELKVGGEDLEVLKARWKYGLVLVGLALLHDENQAKKPRNEEDAENADAGNGENIEKKIERFTKAVAPVLLPMINSLGALDMEGALAMTASGEDT